MTTILEAAGRRLAATWIAQLPGGSWIAEPLGTALGALLGSAQRTAVPQNADSDRLTRAVFGVPNHLSGVEDAGEHVAKLLMSCIPPEVRLPGAPARPTSASAEPERDESNALDELLRNALTNDQQKARAEEVGAAGSEIATTAAAGTTGWTPKKLLDHMKRLIERLARSSPRSARLIAEFELEAAALPFRFALGTSISATELFPFTVASTAAWGREVHRVLQGRYRQGRASHTVVSERSVYAPEWPDGIGLRDAAAATTSTFADFTVLELSRLSPFSRRGNLRDDVIDLYFGVPEGLAWEIKPVRSAPIAVLQECWYRFTYNAWAIAVEEAFGRAVRTKRLETGPGWALLAPPGLLTPFRLQTGPGVITIPYCVDELPGLVLYTLVRLPELADLAFIIVLVRRQIEQQLRAAGELAQRFAEEVAEAIESLGRAIARVLDAFGVLLLALVVVVLILFALASAPAATVLAVGAVLVVLFVPPGEGQRAAQSSTSARTVTMQLGPCRFQDVPLRQLRSVICQVLPKVPQVMTMTSQRLQGESDGRALA